MNGIARKSLKEERKAVSDYTRRAKSTADPKLKRIFKHAKSEEQQHASAFSRYLSSNPTTLDAFNVRMRRK